MADITYAEVSEIIKYDPETGKFYWKERKPSMFTKTGFRSSTVQCARWNKLHSGTEALNSHRGEYLSGRILGRTYSAHRVAWLLHYQAWPSGDIDHINGDTNDNRISNLRDVSETENMRNQARYKNNKSGFTGVGWRKKSGKWFAHIRAEGKLRFLGYFINKEDAVNARLEANKRFGFSSRHGS